MSCSATWSGSPAISARLAPADLIEQLNLLFSGFDEICERTGVEKIKTVGDAYLVIGGLDGRPDHATAIAETALQMIEQVEARRGSRRGRSGSASTAGRPSPG